MSQVTKLERESAVLKLSDGYYISIFLGKERKNDSKLQLWIYRVKLLFPKGDVLLNIVVTPETCEKIYQFLGDIAIFPVPAIAEYLVKAETLNDARILCKELKNKIV